ncbi:MAG: MoaD/ThiS family protein [Terriglobales bacterium]
MRIVLPAHLRQLAGISGDVTLEVAPPPTVRGALDALEAAFPALRGTLRDPATGMRRPYVRFYACQEDLSHASPDDLLPAAVVSGEEPLWIIGAIAGG